jgi:ABC-type Zn uptake system ZnuABC Zn-binding protein ZnuA
MRRLIFGLLLVLVALSTVLTAGAASKLKVVATIPDLKALTEAVGGEHVEVDTLARGMQNAHEVEIKPSLMLKLRRADALVLNGLDLDNWADLLIQGSNNANVVRGGAGVIDASRGVPVLEVPTTRVDRSMGDVHPLGNPHYTIDPGIAPIITGNILQGLVRLAPEHRAAFDRNRQAFLTQVEEGMARWSKALEPFKGAKVVVYHPQWIYLLTRFGLVEDGWVEDRPGIPPSPGHLTQLIRRMKEDRVKVIVYAAWNDRSFVTRIAEETGAKPLLLASMVGGVKGVDSYIGMFDYNVKALAEALQ